MAGPSLGDPTADAGPAATTGEQTVRRRLVRGARRYAPLFGVYLAVTLLRLPEFLRRPYPPGGDIAEQILWAHVWTGSAFSGAPPPLVIPPLYLFTMVLPSLGLFPILGAGIAVDVVVGGLLVFPSYFLLRRIGLREKFALLGAFLLGGSSAYSSILAWNSGYNLFGIVLMTAAFSFVLRHLQTGDRRAAGLGALLIALTGAANFLSLFFAAVVLGALTVGTLLFRARRELLRRQLRMLVWTVVATVPIWPIYIALAGWSYNTVSSPLTISLPAALQLALTIPFGPPASALQVAVLAVDVGFSGLGIILLARRRDTRLGATFLLAVVAAAFVTSAGDPGNITRGYYYLPIALVPAIAAALQGVYDRIIGSPRFQRSAPSRATVPEAMPRRRRARFSATHDPPPIAPWPARSRVTFAVAAGILLLVAGNTAVSYVTLVNSDRFYTPMTNASLNGLHWLRDHVPPGVAVYSSSEYLAKWIWAYANRPAIYPANLNLEVSHASYDQVHDGDMIAMGEYDIGNSLINVGASFPASYGVPTIYLATPGYWNFLFNTQANDTVLSVQDINSSYTQSVALDQATPGPVSLSTNASASQLVESFVWVPRSGGPIALGETILVKGSSVVISWSSAIPERRVVALHDKFYLPPSAPDYQGFRHPSVALGCLSDALSDGLRYQATTFQVSIGAPGASLCQWLRADGWNVINYSGPATVAVAVSGYPSGNTMAPYAVNSFDLLRSEGVGYVGTDASESPPGFGLLLYDRFSNLPASSGFSTRLCFQSGQYSVFGLAGC